MHVCLGAVGLDRHDYRRYAARVLDAIFGGLSSSRLFQAVREERGEAQANVTLGILMEKRGNPEAAEKHYLEAVRLSWQQRDEIQTLFCLETLARFLADHRERSLANELLAGVAHLQHHLGLLETARQGLPEYAERDIADRPPTTAVIGTVTSRFSPLVVT